jgi:cytochrome c oxidase subunit 2
VIFWAGLVVSVAVMAVLIYIMVRYRARPGDGDPKQIHGHTGLEVVWSIAPVLVLLVVAPWTIYTIFDNARSPSPPSEGGLVVEAVGHQWWFEFRYPIQNQVVSEVVTANELHIPVGEPVNVDLETKDVIHSFWVPKLAGKVDMVPNNDNGLWMEADEPGVYFGQCAEFCGVSHANMRFIVIAQPRAEFDAWLAEQARPAASPTEATPLTKLGHDVFVTRNGSPTDADSSVRGAGCNACHRIEGMSAKGTSGPNLTHFASRDTLAGSTMDNTQSELRDWLDNPAEMKPGNLMARDAAVFNEPDGLSEIQISALVAFLRSLE